MRLLIVRHAPAGEREAFAVGGQPDEERPLTQRGRGSMAQIARGLRTLEPVLDLIATSPLLRAVETASIIAQEYEGPEPTLCEALRPGSPPEQLVSLLAREPMSATIAVVGHEPDLGELSSWLLSGLSTSFLSLKKGGACLLEFRDGIGARRCEMIWALPPAVLRELA